MFERKIFVFVFDRETGQPLFPIEERPTLMTELLAADEAFVTSSSREITPVVQVDERVIADGKPGPRTYELEERFIEMIEQRH